MRRAVCGAIVMVSLALAWTVAGAQTRELTMGNVNPAKHGTTLAAQQFADKVAELTGGKVKVIHHHSGALGGEREVAQQVQLGTVDFSPVTTAPLSTLVPEMSVFQLPYIFRDYQHVYAAFDGSDTIRKYYEPVLDKKGMRLIGFFAAGYRGIYGHSPINSLADVRHTHQCVALIMSKSSWAKQDAATQKAIMDAAKHAEQWNRKFILDEDRDIQEQVKAKGVSITKPDATPFRQATASVYEEFYATPAGKDARKMVDYILSK